MPNDPCAAIAGKKWVLPREARACMSATPVDSNIKANIIQVVNKTLAFHTSVNYQIQAPPPYDRDVHEDLKADLAEISHKNSDGTQSVYIAPEAYAVASAEFGEDIQFWDDALPKHLAGKLYSLSGAKVLLINGNDPFVAVNVNALATGGYQSFATRQNSFFASYHRGPNGWEYTMGNFAQQVHPLVDSVSLTIQRINSSTVDHVVLPYRSRFGSASKVFTNLSSYLENNCRPTKNTNGHDLYGADITALEEADSILYFQQQAPVNPQEARRHAINVILDGMPMSDIKLPEELQPPMLSLNESYSVAQFYLLEDHVTGVLALGSFSAENFTTFGQSLLDGLQELKARGATHLIVDVVCYSFASYYSSQLMHCAEDEQRRGLHLYSALAAQDCPKYTTEPQAGLDTTIRAGPLAQLITKKIFKGGDPDDLLYYNPIQWRNASHLPFSKPTEWFTPTVKIINGHKDAFSPSVERPVY
ncbi:hypothetical protein C0992_010706 [Termitomyces sp. T32_za158]|nr:hypothetical protein C0992_010706 [Termitomyces sp. T32_za158]